MDKFSAIRASLSLLLSRGVDFYVYITLDGIEHQFPKPVLKEHEANGYMKLFLGPVVGIGAWDVKDEFFTVEVSFYGKKTTLDIPYENLSTIQMHHNEAVEEGLILPSAAIPIVPGAEGRLSVAPPPSSPVATGDTAGGAGGAAGTARVITGPWGPERDSNGQR